MSEEADPGGTHRFVPVVRQGFRPDPKTKEGEQAYNDNTFSFERTKTDHIQAPIRFTVDLTLEAKEKGAGWVSDPTAGTGDLSQPSTPIRMYGPGDAVGIDHDQVVRVEPEPGASGAPPNYFPVVEFARADLPWLLSPERASESEYPRDPYVDSDGQARIRPWLTLVTVPEPKATVSTATEDGGGLPVLEAPTAQLPSPADSWAWAHAQVLDQAGDETVGDVMESDPARVVSRLLSPRNFYTDDAERYVSAVVPTFEPGRRAGLGREPYPKAQGGGDDKRAPGPETREIAYAWSNDEDGVRLPVYYMWEYTVGEGDFESLAADLRPTALSEASVGVREVDASHPGPERLEGYETYTQTGALIAPSQAAKLANPGNDELTEYDTAKQQTIRTDVLNRIERIERRTGTPVVGPPVYGQWPAEVEQVDALGDSWWLYELNLDPKYRAAAGLGAEVIREHQQEYVTDAWEQVGELEAVNRELRLGRFARSVSDRTFDRLVRSVTDGGRVTRMDRLLQFTSPMHDTLVNASPGLSDVSRSLRAALADELDEPGVPPAIYSGAYRRLTRLGGPLVRNADFDVEVATPTKFATDFTAFDSQHAGLTTEALAPDLNARVTTLGSLANGGSPGRQPISYRRRRRLRQVVESASFPDLAAGGLDPWADDLPSGTLPDEETLEEITPLSETSVPADQFVGSYRLGAWARTLPETTVTPRTVWTADDGGPLARLKRLDKGVQEGLDRIRAALSATRRAAAGEAEPASAVRAVRDVEGALEALRDGLDAVVDTGESNPPGAIQGDASGLLRSLRTDYREAVEGIDPDNPPEDWSSVEDAIERLRDRLVLVREGLYGAGVDDGPPRRFPGDGGRFGDGNLWDDGGPDLGDLLESLNPTKVIPQKVTARLDLPDAEPPSGMDPLAPVGWAPSFGQAMQKPLSGLADEYLLPGTDEVPKNSVGALATNPAFVEAFLAGANHEFTRELIWQEFPCDRRGTYFRTFWDRSVDPDIPAADRPVADIPPMHEWGQGRPLGGESPQPDVVLLLRSELLRQFPNTVIYMAKATWRDDERTADLSQAEKYTEEKADNLDHVLFPTFRGRLEPDVMFLGFDKTPAEATGDADPAADEPGWFFVIEEPMGETRFGLDAGDPADEGGVPIGVKRAEGGDLDGGDRAIDGIGDLQVEGKGPAPEAAWDGLSWWHLAGDPEKGPPYVQVWNSRPGGTQQLNNAAPDETNTWRVTRSQVSDWTSDAALAEARPELATMRAQWGYNSAHLARIAWQRPTRVMIHADDLLSAEASEGAWGDDDAPRWWEWGDPNEPIDLGDPTDIGRPDGGVADPTAATDPEHKMTDSTDATATDDELIRDDRDAVDREGDR